MTFDRPVLKPGDFVKLAVSPFHGFGLPMKDAKESWRDREAFKAAGYGCHMLVISVSRDASDMSCTCYKIRVMLPSGHVADIFSDSVELL
jgi:hypothetical protein